MNTRVKKTAIAFATLTIFALSHTNTAQAHVGVSADSTSAGSYSVLSFAIPHGCAESPTTRISIEIPKEILQVTPSVNANWTVEKLTEKLTNTQVTSGGKSLTERVSHVVYTAKTPLPSDLRDVVSVSLFLPEDSEGKTLAFPVTQDCVTGQTVWNEAEKDGEAEPKHPAPAIVVTAALADTHDHSSHASGEKATHADKTAASEPSMKTDSPTQDIFARVISILALLLSAATVTYIASSRSGRSARKTGVVSDAAQPAEPAHPAHPAEPAQPVDETQHGLGSESAKDRD